MGVPVDERARFKRAEENERILRDANEEIEREAREAERAHEVRHRETELEFFCACGRSDCDATLLLTLSEYEAAHTVPDRFIVAPGHELPEIERVVEDHRTYYVVKKLSA